jgi:hypothetical protein
MQVEVTLYPDSGATLNAAGDGWQAVLCLDDDELISAEAAGENDLKPLCTGTVDLFFPATASLVSRRVADFPGGMYGVSGGVHVKVASSGTHMSSGDVMLLEGPMHRVTADPRSDSRLNGYPLSSHGESTPQDGLATVFGLFGTPNFPRFPTGPIKCQVGHHCQLSVGDLIDADGELQQRVIDVRTGTRGSGDSRHTVFFVSTERVVDGGFASEGPAHILLRNGSNVRVTRAGRRVKPSFEGGSGPLPKRPGCAQNVERKPPRFAKLAPGQAAINLGLTTMESLQALMDCTVGIRDEGIGNMPTLASLRDGPYLQWSAK